MIVILLACSGNRVATFNFPTIPGSSQSVIIHLADIQGLVLLLKKKEMAPTLKDAQGLLLFLWTLQDQAQRLGMLFCVKK